MITTILQLLASLSLLVVIHEFGHFFFARVFKIRVEKFYIFFNPFFTLFKFKPKNSDTEYGIGWLPLGGYTKIAGMIDESMDTDQMSKPAQPWEFRSHPAWHRLLVMVGGVLFNFILALGIYSGLSYIYGETYLPIESVKDGFEYSEVAHKAGFEDGDIPVAADGEKIITFNDKAFHQIINAKEVTVLRNGKAAKVYIPYDMMQQLMSAKQGFADYRFPFIVDSIMASSPAQAAGLQANDTVIAINGQSMYASDIRITIHNNAGKKVNMTVLRGKDTLNVAVTPAKDGMMGVFLQYVTAIYPVKTIKYNLLESIPAGIKKGVGKLTGYASDMKYVFTKEGAGSVGGFGTLAQLYPSTFNWQMFWEMTAFLSVILAFMNILPIPALDGGHILFLLYEIITRKKPSQNVLIKAQTIGMIFLFALFLYANIADIFRYLLH